MATILVTGASGFIGSRLCEHLLSLAYDVIGLTRNVKLAQKILPNVKWIDSLESIDGQLVNGVINLAGQPIAKGRWTEPVKKIIVGSRVDFTNNLHDFFSRQAQAPEWLINGSAIGYYGIHEGDSVLPETADTNDCFSHRLCENWERSAKTFEALGTRVCLLRLGIVLGKNGGALASMMPPFKMGVGGPIGKGKHWMSWVHLEDVINIIDFCINQSISGPINAVAPEAVINRVFSKSLASAINRPCFMKTPAFVLKLIFGEMAEELLLSGQRVGPMRLQEEGFVFKFPTIDSAFADIVAT